MKKRYLIISADDFGYCECVNDAIVELFRAGRITSSGILAPSRLAKEACALAARENLSVGVHWTLTNERDAGGSWKPCAGAENVPSLAEGGVLPFGVSALKKMDPREVDLELDAQVRFLLQNGAPVDHADSHCGTLYGIGGRLFFFNAFRACRRYKLPFRFATNDAFLARQFEKQPDFALRTARKMITFCGKLYGVSTVNDFFSEPHPFSLIKDENELHAYYEKQLETIVGERAEIFFHPSLPDGDMERNAEGWTKRVWEYKYLRSGKLLQKAEKLGFTIASWREAFPRLHREAAGKNQVIEAR